MISHTDRLFSGTIGANGDTTATPIITKYDKEAIIFLDITAATGTNPTLDLTIKVYDPLSSKWFILATFSQKTGAGTDVGYVAHGIDEKMALFYVIGGTDIPTFTFSVNVHLKTE